MYDLVYSIMVEAGILETFEQPVWMDVNGKVVESEGEAHRKKTNHRVKYPNYQLCVNEVGNNTNMKHNDNVGGEELLKAKGD